MGSIGRIMTVACLIGAGCGGIELDEGELVQPVLDCEVWNCNSNSPVIDHYGFHELNIHGIRDAEGFSITGLVRDMVWYQPSVVRGRLQGTNGSMTISGSELINAQLIVHHVSGFDYSITIDGVSTTLHYWASLGGVPPTVETYRMTWKRYPSNPGEQPTNVCSNPIASDNERLGMGELDALLFEGDRINARSKTIQKGDPAWFNIGCAGHTLAKLQLTGHTTVAESDGFLTTVPERQTMLKMISADYCGTGKPFTVAGIPLNWRDDHGWMGFDVTMANLEARWSPSGATCLSEPRLQVHSNAASIAYFGTDTIAAIRHTCAVPPACGGPVSAQDGMHLVSANPVP